MKNKNLSTHFKKSEILLWSSSIIIILLSFIIFDRESYLTLISSIIGVTSLILNAKGNPIGQILMIIFSVLYGIISLTFAYYGEMITYLGMTAPMALFALISWLKNPYNGNKSEVRVSNLKINDFIFMFILSAVVTFIFYYILKAFNTKNLFLSTISVTTSFIAAWLTFKRSEYFALLYALNDIVLIFLWILASIEDISYLSVIICFLMFLINDLYGFFNWQKMKKRQSFDG